MPDYAFRKDDSAAALGASAAAVKGRMRIGGQEHFYLEGQVALALPGEDGDMLVHSSTQHPSEVQHLVAQVLGVPDNAVTVECAAWAAASAARKRRPAQRAVLAALAARSHRPAVQDPARSRRRHDASPASGTISSPTTGRVRRQRPHRAIETVIVACGFSADLSGPVDRAMFHADNAYFLPAARSPPIGCKTNTVSTRPFAASAARKA